MYWKYKLNFNMIIFGSIMVCIFLFTFFIAYTYKSTLKEIFFSKPQLSQAVDLRKVGATGKSNVQKAFPNPRLRDIIYKVQPNDTYWKIARKNKVSDIDTLKKYNDERKLHPGMEIKIPRHLIKYE